MRYTALLTLLAFISFSITAQPGKTKKDPKKPVMVAKAQGVAFFESTSVNFGRIMESSGRVSKAFNFNNIGKGPLRILNVATSCGCTTPQWPREPIPPGGNGVLLAEYDPKGRPGEFNRTLTVTTDGEPSTLYLSLKGDVLSEDYVLSLTFPAKQGNLRMATDVMNFKEVKEHTVDTFLLDLYNTSKRSMRIESIKTPNHMKSLNGTGKTILPNGGGLQIMFLYYGDQANDMGERVDEVTIQTSDDTLSNKRLIVKANILPDFSRVTGKEKANPPKISFNKTEHDFGDIYLSERVTYQFEMTNKGKSDLVIREASGVCGCTVSNIREAVTLSKGQKKKLEITFDATRLRGKQEKIVNVYSNDPEHPVTLLKIRAKVVDPGKDR